MKLPTLQPFYYLDHFLEMLNLVKDRCGKLLGPEEHRYLTEFQDLPKTSQALLVRILNRKGLLVRLDKLSYPEISDPTAATRELIATRFAKHPNSDLATEMAQSFTKPELLKWFRTSETYPRGASSLPKAALVELAAKQGFADQIPKELFICLDRAETIGYLKFLYFGRLQDDLQAFTLRDLGLVKTRNSSDGSFRCVFPDSETARRKYFYANLKLRIRSAAAEQLSDFLVEIDDWPSAENCPERDTAISRLGARFERANMPEPALKTYLMSTSHPARERSTRLLFSAGLKQQARKILDSILENPDSDEELIFAEDFLSRKFGESRTGLLTNLLRDAPAIQIDEAFRDGAERPAIKHFELQGWEAWHTENWIWTTLFGIFFWEELHDHGSAETHNEFDLRPASLRDGTFYKRHKGRIEAKLEKINSDETAALLETTFTEHFGTANGIFRWARQDLEILLKLLRASPLDSLATVLRLIAKDPNGFSTGFPDLMLIRENKVRFVEVKAEGDQIRRNQLARLRMLADAGFDVGFVRVQWIVDPSQTYVVVDIETTGGRAQHHRITEIGAVKIRNGEIVDRFTTLIDPERSIPRNITRLTGITDTMVSGKPKFAEIAQAFDQFTQDAVFVAHSAKFDYGFIRQEFSRLGTNYRRPTLCTVVAMRKYFPGLSAYGLAPLCQEFGIELTRHHRAMADAEATADLLKLINAKRLAGQV
ncbi:MAG: exonuclease domain-containing protein [Akkermansiaceae bacterium]